MRLITLLCLSGIVASAIAAPNTIHQYTLDNGMKVVVKEDHRAPVAVSMVWYNVGSADEPGGITGVSHALEHMMFKGTPTHPAGVFSKTIAHLGGEENAFTHYDYTAYFEKVSNTALEKALALEADRMQHLTLNPSDFSKEIKVVQEERRLRTDNQPNMLAMERFMAASQLSAPYQHPVIGWMSDLHTMRSHDLRAWYQHFYVPNNAVLVVVGDVQAQDIHHMAEQYFGNIPKGPQYVRKPQQEPEAIGPKKITVYAHAKVPFLILGYTVPSVVSAPGTRKPFALEALATLLGAPNSGLLTKTLVRTKNPLASAIDAEYSPYWRFQNQFLLLATPTAGTRLPQLKESILKEIKKLQTTPIAAEVLTRVKTQLIAQKTFEEDALLTQATTLGTLEILGIGAQACDDYKVAIAALTAEDIQTVARDYFQDKALTEAEVFPDTLPQNPTAKQER